MIFQLRWMISMASMLPSGCASFKSLGLAQLLSSAQVPEPSRMRSGADPWTLKQLDSA